MEKKFPRPLALFSLLLLFVVGAQAQDKTPAKQPSTTDAPGGKIVTGTPKTATDKIVITATTSPADLARAAFMAQGGEKARNLKSMVLTGSVELYAPNSLQSVPGKFVIVTAGERSRTELQSPVFNYRQISDGTKTYTSVAQMEMPPPNKFGISVLMKFDQPGYTVSALPDDKKLRAFRITDADGHTTDFFVEPATGRVMSYVIPYNGLTFGVEHKSFKEIDGVLVPYTFTQRLEMRQGAAFADFKVKDVKLNQELADDVFEIPEQQ